MPLQMQNNEYQTVEFTRRNSQARRGNLLWLLAFLAVIALTFLAVWALGRMDGPKTPHLSGRASAARETSAPLPVR